MAPVGFKKRIGSIYSQDIQFPKELPFGLRCSRATEADLKRRRTVSKSAQFGLGRETSDTLNDGHKTLLLEVNSRTRNRDNKANTHKQKQSTDERDTRFEPCLGPPSPPVRKARRAFQVKRIATNRRDYESWDDQNDSTRLGFLTSEYQKNRLQQRIFSCKFRKHQQRI